MHWIALSSAPDATPGSDGEQPADPRLALAWRALAFTPRVALQDEAVLIEVSGSERLWGGRARLLELLLKQNQRLAPVHASFCATSLQALGLLRLAAAGLPAPERLPDALPLSVLSAARPHLATLARIGCGSWGELRALPRAGVARRFGMALLDALDLACGQRAEVHLWLALPERFDASFELPALAEHAPGLLFGAQRLLLQLRVWLEGRRLGVLAFALSWRLDARRANHARQQQQLIVRTAQPTQDVAHLARLLAEQLARMRLAAPVQGLRLRSLDVAQLAPPTSASLLPEHDRDASAAHGASLQQLIERLAARLGAAQVLHAVAQADHRPERMQRWQAVLQAGCLSAAQNPGAYNSELRPNRQRGQGLPTWLLREPLPLVVQGDRPQFHGPLQLLAGPHRIESGWWLVDTDETAAAGWTAASRPALRDYFIARGERTGLLWIYREQPRRAELETAAAGGRWFLHGLYA